MDFGFTKVIFLNPQAYSLDGFTAQPCPNFRVVTKRLENDTVDVPSSWESAFILHYTLSG